MAYHSARLLLVRKADDCCSNALGLHLWHSRRQEKNRILVSLRYGWVADCVLVSSGVFNRYNITLKSGLISRFHFDSLHVWVYISYETAEMLVLRPGKNRCLGIRWSGIRRLRVAGIARSSIIMFDVWIVDDDVLEKLTTAQIHRDSTCDMVGDDRRVWLCSVVDMSEYLTVSSCRLVFEIYRLHWRAGRYVEFASTLHFHYSDYI